MLSSNLEKINHLQAKLADPNSPIDSELLLKFTGENWEFALEIIHDFLINVTDYIKECKAAVEFDNPIILKHNAHKIKGASAQTAIKKMPSIAQKLESQAKLTNLNNAPQLIAEMETILIEVERVINN